MGNSITANYEIGEKIIKGLLLHYRRKSRKYLL